MAASVGLLSGQPLQTVRYRASWLLEGRRNASVATYRHAASILASKGKRLVISLKNGYEGAAPVNAKIGRLCPVPLDGIAAGMAGVPWIRCASPSVSLRLRT